MLGLDLFPYSRGAGLDGAVKLNSFFIIAGFYTQLLLSEKFANMRFSHLRFAISRILRLYPVYYIALLLNIILDYCGLGGLSKIHDALFEQGSLTDWLINITAVTPEIFHYTDLNMPVMSRLLVSYSWFLGVDLTIIVVAPFFLSKGERGLWAFALLSFVFAFYYWEHGWLRTYVGASLIYFSIGYIGYRFYRKYLYKRDVTLSKRGLAYAMVALIAAMFASEMLVMKHLGDEPGYFFIISMVAVFLPFIAAYTRGLSWDRAIGELAYPMYLSHEPFARATYTFAKQHLGHPLGATLNYAVAFYMSFCFAVLCHYYIERVIKRQKERVGM